MVDVFIKGKKVSSTNETTAKNIQKYSENKRQTIIRYSPILSSHKHKKANSF